MNDKRLNLMDYEREAAQHLDANAYGYYAGGAADEVTLRDNREAFERIKLAPHMLVDVSERHLDTAVLDQRIAAPIIIAPMAVMKLAHPDGELGMVRAAGSKGIPLALSTMATTRIEQVAEAATAPLWFQLYVYKDREITRQLVARAEAAGYTALVLTVDVSVPGLRERDVRNGFKMPPGIRLENLADFALGEMADKSDDSAIAAYAATQFDTTLTWKDLEWLAGLTKLPILVKGIMRPDDANAAIDHGAKGVIVSNHGGRQLDTTPAGIDALPYVVDEIGYRGEVLMDGGVRRGTDIFKALAYGARAVMIGRPMLWGLAVNGEAGVAHILQILMDELDNTMALAGCTKVDQITSDMLFMPNRHRKLL